MSVGGREDWLNDGNDREKRTLEWPRLENMGKRKGDSNNLLDLQKEAGLLIHTCTKRCKINRRGHDHPRHQKRHRGRSQGEGREEGGKLGSSVFPSRETSRGSQRPKKEGAGHRSGREGGRNANDNDKTTPMRESGKGRGDRGYSTINLASRHLAQAK